MSGGTKFDIIYDRITKLIEREESVASKHKQAADNLRNLRELIKSEACLRTFFLCNEWNSEINK